MEVQKLTQVLEKTSNIYMMSTLKDEEYKYTFTSKINSIEEGLDKALKLKGINAKIAIIPEGPYVLGKIKSAKER